MAPLIVMVAATLLFRVLGAVGILDVSASWVGALRLGLAAMFAFTGFAHFHPRTRPQLVSMVPRRLPWPEFLVTVTGGLELAGAVGLVAPGLERAAAYGLALLLVALFPANVRAARAQLTVADRPAMALRWRLPLQIFWIAALIWVAATSSSGAPARAR